MNPHRPAPPRRPPAFTMLELLVVITVIAILAMLLLAAVTTARRHARDANCKNNLSQMWKAINLYVSSADRKPLFPNLLPQLKISNVTFKEQTHTGLGYLYLKPEYLPDMRSYYCPADPVREPRWEYGWEKNWDVEGKEVQCSYGYRGRHGITDDETAELTLAVLESNPKRMLVAEYYENLKRIHHKGHINILRCNGQVVAVDQSTAYVRFGPTDEDFDDALAVLDR